MEESINIRLGRREFLGAVMAAVFTGAAVHLTGCNDSTSSNTDAGAGTVEAALGHTHTVSISKAQMDAGTGVTLTLEGSGHTHALILTDQQVKDIAAGVHTTKLSELGGSTPHQHTVHFA